MPSASVVAAGMDRQIAQLGPHRGIGAGLDPDQLDARRQRLGGDRDAAEHAATTDRHDDRVEARQILQHLERDGALAADDVEIVVGVDEGQTVARRQPRRLDLGLGDGLAGEHDMGAEGARRRHLHVGRRLGHDDGRGDAEPGRMVGDRLGVVAGRHGDDAGGALLGRQRQELGQRAAFLEGVGDLQVLVFDPDLGAGQP